MDTLLASLQYGADGVFNLARNLGSISIRDQMIRATLVAHALPVWLKQRYGEAAGEKPVLVVGAGACGMTLAVGLARSGIRVEVVDTDERAFGLQRRCASRWFDGVQYDWPMDQWGGQAKPAPPGLMPQEHDGEGFTSREFWADPGKDFILVVSSTHACGMEGLYYTCEKCAYEVHVCEA
jgi:hypothetical protein